MAEQWNLNGVSVIVKGQPAAPIDASLTLAEAVRMVGQSSGLRTASVYDQDGKILAPTDGGKTLNELGIALLEIKAKDDRA